jgi:hypothetical protein
MLERSRETGIINKDGCFFVVVPVRESGRSWPKGLDDHLRRMS